jgi:hypothetical protein
MMFQAKKYTQPWSKSNQVNMIKQEIIRSCDTFKKKQLLSAKIDLSVFTEKGLGLLKKQQINQHQTELLNKEKISRLAITVHQPILNRWTHHRLWQGTSGLIQRKLLMQQVHGTEHCHP